MKGFLSYAHEDSKMVRILRKHLAPIGIDSWVDEEILAGDNWRSTIRQALAEAEIFLFCVSPSFVTSKYIASVELPAARKKYESGDAIVVPVILRRCIWDHLTFLSGLQAVPRFAKPISSFRSHEEGYHNAAVLIREMVRVRRDR